MLGQIDYSVFPSNVDNYIAAERAYNGVTPISRGKNKGVVPAGRRSDLQRRWLQVNNKDGGISYRLYLWWTGNNDNFSACYSRSKCGSKDILELRAQDHRTEREILNYILNSFNITDVVYGDDRFSVLDLFTDWGSSVASLERDIYFMDNSRSRVTHHTPIKIVRDVSSGKVLEISGDISVPKYSLNLKRWNAIRKEFKPFLDFARIHINLLPEMDKESEKEWRESVKTWLHSIVKNAIPLWTLKHTIDVSLKEERERAKESHRVRQCMIEKVRGGDEKDYGDFLHSIMQWVEDKAKESHWVKQYMGEGLLRAALPTAIVELIRYRYIEDIVDVETVRRVKRKDIPNRTNHFYKSLVTSKNRKG
tara:strand:- start:1349 stop:2440 length:1092 start_codon:yes stop_codon:yes gene_type:complete